MSEGNLGKPVGKEVCESGNAHDPFAVAVFKEDNIVGHLPRTISAPCYVFLGKPQFVHYL